jgi:hypothetical protein
MKTENYTIINKKSQSLCECATLNEAMNAAKHIAEFVIIKGPDFEVCGIFGVDAVKDGKTPDGVAYTWNKASRIGRMKKERI